MLKGIHLTVMIGPVIAVPVPQSILDSLTSVTVTVNSGPRSPSVFELVFTLSNKSVLQTLFLIAGGTPIPLVRVVLMLTVNGTPEVLIDGLMTDHQISPGSDTGFSTVTIKGQDLTAAMDYQDFSGFPFPAMPAEARVALLIAKYAMFGIIPLVVPSVMLDFPNPMEMIPRQKGTDLKYINQLADIVGYEFYISSGPAPGANVAYWGPRVTIGVPQPALNVNMDAYTNVENISFSYTNDQKAMPIVWIQEPFSKATIPIPIPDFNPLSPPLGIIEPIPTRFEPVEGTAKLKPVQALLIALAKQSLSADAVSASGSLDVVRYGRVLKARQLVGVRGGGMAFDGLYFVKSVKHRIKKGEYKQDFTLIRNGLVSTVSAVPA
ncbi:MAG TPA: hypothetical protein VKD70_11845 [Candidatus Acidoferrum sp.]|nr:hypothetical protein [Candidatus Acidoferrum sp.]